MGRTLYRAAVLADSPIGFWEGQDTSGVSLVDTISGQNLVLTGGTLGQTGPMSDRVILQPGGTNSARALISTETTTLTMEIIANYQVITQDNQTLFYNGNSGSNGYGIIVGLSGSSGLKILLGGVTVGAQTGFLTGGFDHVVLRRDAANAWSIWLNGANVGSGGVGSTSPGAPSGGSLAIAGSVAFQFAWAYYAFYSTDLSDARILAHYAAIGTADPSPNQVLTAPPVRVFSNA